MTSDDRDRGSGGNPPPEEGPARGDPFAVELNEDFVNSASVTELSGEVRARKARQVAAAAKQAEARKAAEQARAQVADKRRSRAPRIRVVIFAIIVGGVVAALLFL